MKQLTSKLIFLVIVGSIVSCTKPEVSSDVLPIPFNNKPATSNNVPVYTNPWLTVSKRYTYSYNTQTTSIPQALSLYIETRDEGRFDLTLASKDQFPCGMWGGMTIINKQDGLYGSVCYGCGFSGFCISKIEFMRVPLSATLNTIYPEYMCEYNLNTGYKVIAINSIINIPSGTFNTVVLQDTSTLIKEYWNEKWGLVRIETFDSSGQLYEYYNINL